MRFGVSGAVLVLTFVLAAGCGGEDGGPQPTCTDGTLNQGEEDTDCGGPCPPCNSGCDCLVGSDCFSGVCIDCRCGTLCEDGILSGDETDVDCGGSCDGCRDYQACIVDSDCQGGWCLNGLCNHVGDTCNDAILNGYETDLDCGGGACPPCEVGGNCLVDDDCWSENCIDEFCEPLVQETCNDGVMNQGETDVDCGGPCPECPDPCNCVSDGDCLSGVCIDCVCAPAQDPITGGLADLDLSVDRRVFNLDLAVGDYSPYVTPGNGCSITYEADTGFGGAPGLRVVPPDTLVGENAQYCGFASSADLWAGGTVDIAQINIRYMIYVGAEYGQAIANHGPKAIIPYVYESLDAIETANSARPMVFWGSTHQDMPAGHAAIGVTSGTVQSYQEPENDWFPMGPGHDEIYFGPAPDHAGSATSGTPVVGDEWVCIEHEFDMRQDRGNPLGLNRLYVWTSDGVLDGALLDIPLTWDPGHNFGGQYIGGLDGIGHYWNDPALRLPEGFLIYSDLAFAANRAPGDPIGPPAGF